MPTRSRWALPAVIDPPDRLCAVVPVPNDREHIAAFMGALYDLAKAYAWQNDASHTAMQVAAVWLNIWENIRLGNCALGAGGDDVQFRQNGCKLEFSIDCVHWQTLYDPTACINAIAAQPGGGGIIQPGDCREYDVTLRGNDQWLLPVPVSTGFTVTVSAATGGWYDGATLVWRCPDGRVYLLGACGGATVTEPGDPINTAPHMTLLTRLDTTGPQWFEILTGTYTVPAAVTNVNLTFQANDSGLADNAGSITFHVKVCNANAADTWCYDWDFTAAGPFNGLSFGAYGHHVAGVGLVSDTVFGSSKSIIASLLWADRTITHAEITTCFDQAPSGGGAGSTDVIYLNGVAGVYIDINDIYVGCTTHTWDGSVVADQLYMNPSGALAGDIKITHAKIRGLGANPFGADTCI